MASVDTTTHSQHPLNLNIAIYALERTITQYGHLGDGNGGFGPRDSSWSILVELATTEAGSKRATCCLSQGASLGTYHRHAQRRSAVLQESQVSRARLGSFRKLTIA